jgi:hypothetical protein
MQAPYSQQNKQKLSIPPSLATFFFIKAGLYFAITHTNVCKKMANNLQREREEIKMKNH